MTLGFSVGRKMYLFYGFAFFAAVAAASIVMDIILGQWLWIIFSAGLAVAFGFYAYYGYFLVKNDLRLTKQGVVARIGKDDSSYHLIRWQDIDFIQPRENATMAFEIRVKSNSPTMQYFLEKYPQIWNNLDSMPAARGHLAFFTDVLTDEATKEQSVVSLSDAVKLLNDYRKSPKLRENLPDTDPKYTWEVLA